MVPLQHRAYFTCEGARNIFQGVGARNPWKQKQTKAEEETEGLKQASTAGDRVLSGKHWYARIIARLR